VVACCVVGVALGCRPAGPTYSESTNSYTTTNLDALFELAAKSERVGSAPAEVAELRHQALVALRGAGSGGSAAAKVITQTFPAETRGVPVLAEKARFQGEPALIVVEVIGPPGKPLDDTRLWVVSESGDILYSEVR
jgi:hypothetical protein